MQKNEKSDLQAEELTLRKSNVARHLCKI